jgi:hypothetical protein
MNFRDSNILAEIKKHKILIKAYFYEGIRRLKLSWYYKWDDWLIAIVMCSLLIHWIWFHK